MGIPIWDDSIDSEENYIRTKISMDNWTSRSGASLFQELKDLGFSIGENRFYEIRRDVLNFAVHQEQISSLHPDTLIPKGFMEYFPDWKMSTNYMYNVKYTYTIGDDKTEHEDYFTLSSNERLSTEQIEGAASNNLVELRYERDGKQITIQSVDLEHAYRRV